MPTDHDDWFDTLAKGAPGFWGNGTVLSIGVALVALAIVFA